MSEISPALMQKLKTDFPGYCKRFFKIKTKEGKLAPFVLNEPQMIIWRKLEQMMADDIPIRIVVLKARQYGIDVRTLHAALAVLLGRS